MVRGGRGSHFSPPGALNGERFGLGREQEGGTPRRGGNGCPAGNMQRQIPAALGQERNSSHICPDRKLPPQECWEPL